MILVSLHVKHLHKLCSSRTWMFFFCFFFPNSLDFHTNTACENAPPNDFQLDKWGPRFLACWIYLPYAAHSQICWVMHIYERLQQNSGTICRDESGQSTVVVNIELYFWLDGMLDVMLERCIWRMWCKC